MDRYGDTLVAQFSSCGAERWKQVIVDALLAQTGLTRLYERSDASVRTLEGLPEATGWLAGSGDTGLVITEHDWKLSLDVAEGHKTGFYLDQRDSRQKFAVYARRLGFKDVLNCYCYTGGFTVAALAGGAAHVTSIDSSGPAIERAAANVALNGFDASRTTMSGCRRERHRCASSSRKAARSTPSCSTRPSSRRPSTHAERAARAYKDINRLALSSCWRPAACCSPIHARAASAPICSTRSWPRPAPTRAWTASSANAWAARPTTR